MSVRTGRDLFKGSKKEATSPREPRKISTVERGRELFNQKEGK